MKVDSRYLDALGKKVIVFDGAMGTNLQNLNLTADDFGGEHLVGCNDYLSVSCPKAVESVHRSFLEVGVDVIETNTFRSNRLTLREYGLQDETEKINISAASLAKKLANEFSTPDHPRFVVGSMGPSGKLPSMKDPELSDISFDELVDIFCQQAKALIKGGVDLLIIETSQDILEVKTAILGIEQAFQESSVRLPVQAQVTLDTSGKMLLGTDIAAVLTILEGMPINVIGLNCSTGPEHMRESIRYLATNSTMPVSCLPNAGLPLNIDGEAVYPMKPEPYSEALAGFVEQFGINVVGGCCGTTPEHLKLLVEKVSVLNPSERKIIRVPRLASSTMSVNMRQEPAPFLIGERLNSQGSRIFKRLLLEENFEKMLSIADQQVNNGAHGLDVCTALTERPDEDELMRRLTKELSLAVQSPLIIDTTELNVLEIALQTAPGRCLINSTNLESGREKADQVFSLAKKYNAAVITLTIDEKGMAKTASRKLEIAHRIFQIATEEHHLNPEDLVFDTLTFTLATGDEETRNSAIETIESIRSIKKELPRVLTSLGVSNVSFGLKPSARAVLNSVMLYHAIQAGLDMAIVNPAQIKPYAEISADERTLAEDLIFNRHPEALQKLIEYFEENATDQSEKEDKQKDKFAGLNTKERIHKKILLRVKEDIEIDIDEIIEQSDGNKSDTAVNILNQVLLPAMKEVGDKFGKGELILPFVLQSAEVMKKAVSHLENYLDKQSEATKGKVVLATVYGDVHDIGKNLVKTILSNNGYDIIDLGKQVPAEDIISKAIEVRADAIGLSALLVSTSKQMPLIVNELERRDLHFPVLVGGAAINQEFGSRIQVTDNGKHYEPGVFYCKDAFDGLNTMDALINPQQRSVLIESNRLNEKKNAAKERSIPEASQKPQVSEVPPANFIPTPPSWGVKVVRELPLDMIFKHLNTKELFRLSWGGKNTHGEEWEKLSKEFEDRLEKMRRQALSEKWLHPQAVYGYYPAQSDGDDLIIYRPEISDETKPEELLRFNFPRQIKGEALCLSDYFSPVTSGTMDVVAFQIVTVGSEATERFDRLQSEGNYSEAYFTHGLAVQVAEATAEYLHLHIRKELNIDENQGKRYSWGFPAIPEISDHQKVFQLLPVEKELNMSLTAAYQLVPEQSTAAIVVHHPKAKYYAIGERRIDQLLKK